MNKQYADYQEEDYYNEDDEDDDYDNSMAEGALVTRNMSPGLDQASSITAGSHDFNPFASSYDQYSADARR